MNKNVTVYGLSAGDGPVRYIGQTTRPTADRLAQHMHTIKRKCATAVHKWMLSHINRGDAIRLTVLVEKAVWHETEKRVIAAYRVNGFALLNLTDGGDGTLGFRHQGRSRPDLAERNRSRVGQPGRQRLPGETEKLMAYVRGSKRPWVSERNRLSKGKPGHKHTEEHKRSVGDRCRGVPIPQEATDKQKATKAAWSPERRAEIGRRISESKKAAFLAKANAGGGSAIYA